MTIHTIPRRLPEVGRLRLGQKLPTRNGTRPAALDAWRLTSKSRYRLEAAAQLYGGTVQEWKDAPGEDTQWELFTEAKALRVAVVPTLPVTQFYEHWSAGGCQRRCDGITELLSGDGCLCAVEADDPTDFRCKPTTRLSVLLPDLPGLGVWRVETHGYYGAAELAASAELLSSFGRPMPVALLIDQRSERRPGKPRRDYVVPMLDSRQSFLDLQALASADMATGEMNPAGRPALEQSDPGLRTGGVGSMAPGDAGESAPHSPGSDPTSGADGPPTGTEAAKVQPDLSRRPAGSRTAPDPNAGSGSVPHTRDAGAAAPGIQSPPSPNDPEAEPTEADRSRAEGAHVDGTSKPGAVPPDGATTPPEGSSTPPGRPSGGTTSPAGSDAKGARPGPARGRRGNQEESHGAAAGRLPTTEQGQAGDDPDGRRFAR
jgi:hypothetical protein